MNPGVARKNALAAKPTDVHNTLDPKTREDLLTARHGEAFAYLKYQLCAEQVRKNGNEKLADLFEKTANVKSLEEIRHGEMGNTDAFRVDLKKRKS